MTKDKALKLALEALESCSEDEWRSDDDYGMMQVYDADKVNEAIPAIKEALAQDEHGPVAVWELQEDGWDTICDGDWLKTLPVGTKLYTTPPKREWVGLTDEETETLIHRFYGDPHTLLDEVNARLKKKNT